MLSKVLAGASLAGKTMLGAGIAVAATGGAGAAGVLPSPVQHTFAVVVDHATPFTAPDSSSGDTRDAAPGSGEHDHSTSTSSTSASSDVSSSDGSSSDSPLLDTSGTGTGDTTTTTSGAPTTDPPSTEPPSTEPPSTEPPSHGHEPGVTPPPGPPTPHDGGGSGDGNGSGDGSGDHPGSGQGDGGGEHHSPESIQLSCSLSAPGTAHCEWTGGTLNDGDSYMVLRVSRGVGRAFRPAAGATSYDDATLEADHEYSFMVIIVHDGTPGTLAHSNRVSLHTAPVDNPGGGGQSGGGDSGGGTGGGTGAGDSGGSGHASDG